MKHIPILLTYSRIPIGGIILFLAAMQPVYCRAAMVALVFIGLLTDIFDGIIARRMGISTEKLRRLDSSVDQVFWIMVLAGTCIVSPAFYKGHMLQLIVVLSLEAFTYALSYLKFRKEVATHAILSKIWALTIFATIVQSMATSNTGWTFDLCYYIGIGSRMEVILILLIIKKWTNDVPSVYHAFLLRQGKEIKRNKWFNG